MKLRRWSELAAEAPDAPAIVTRERTLSRSEVLTEVRARDTGSAAPLALVGAVTLEAVLDVLAAIDRGAPVLLIHPRWTERERDVVLARLAHIDTAKTGDERTLAVVHTSGTTGTPRGAVLSRRAFVASARASAAHLGALASDRWLLSMPLAHVGGLGIVVRSLVYGTALVVLEGAFEPSVFFELARSANVTHVSVVPTMLARLLDERSNDWPLSLRCILVGGAACPESVLERALAAELPIHATYGLTETCGQVATRRTLATSSSDARTLDLLPDVTARIANGRVLVRHPAALDGWLGEDGSALDEEGFYDTGDLGDIDGERLVVHARRTDLIVSGGENVYPREVEDALERIPNVTAACVFGVPDVHWGQRVAAAIVRRGELEPSALLDALRPQLAGYKTPRLVAWLEQLPLGATGKVDRRAAASVALPLLRPL